MPPGPSQPSGLGLASKVGAAPFVPSSAAPVKSGGAAGSAFSAAAQPFVPGKLRMDPITASCLQPKHATHCMKAHLTNLHGTAPCRTCFASAGALELSLNLHLRDYELLHRTAVHRTAANSSWFPAKAMHVLFHSSCTRSPPTLVCARVTQVTAPPSPPLGPLPLGRQQGRSLPRQPREDAALGLQGEPNWP